MHRVERIAKPAEPGPTEALAAGFCVSALQHGGAMKLRSRFVALALLLAAAACGLIPTGHKGGGGGNGQTVVFVADSFGTGSLTKWVVDTGSLEVDPTLGNPAPSAVLRNAQIHSVGFGHDSSILGGITLRASIKRDSGVAIARLVHAHVGPLAIVKVFEGAAVY